jgi:hypothetical protein
MNCKKCQDLESANASESIPDVSCDSRTSQLLCSERKLSGTSITDTDCKKSGKASNREQSLQRKAVSCHKCDQGFCACSRVSSQSLSSCHGCEDLVCITDREECCSLHATDEILMTNIEDTFISKSDHTLLPHDSQLQENDGVSRVLSIIRKIHYTNIVIKWKCK